MRISFLRCGSLFLDRDLTLVDPDLSPVRRAPSRDDHTNDEAVSIRLLNALQLSGGTLHVQSSAFSSHAFCMEEGDEADVGALAGTEKLA
ncbi:MAG TPA: hypothetical protein VNN25_09845 [Thermoanaerobaculia bacterium]|nr:hypothetical protein [Thermoanaerobaculia bacterium]